MKTQDEIKAEALKLIIEKAREDYKPIDSDALYNALLDELYQDKMDEIDERNAILAAVKAYAF